MWYSFLSVGWWETKIGILNVKKRIENAYRILTLGVAGTLTPTKGM